MCSHTYGCYLFITPSCVSSGPFYQEMSCIHLPKNTVAANELPLFITFLLYIELYTGYTTVTQSLPQNIFPKNLYRKVKKKRKNKKEVLQFFYFSVTGKTEKGIQISLTENNSFFYDPIYNPVQQRRI